MSLHHSQYKEQLSIHHASVTETDTPASRLLALLDDSSDLLFQGKEDVQPIKIYQISRIYKLARICIELITLLWPILRKIIPLLRKMF